jgi:NAD(P)-dependent dehydrogenase (short-subunit alcohol dehydrogenase family)
MFLASQQAAVYFKNQGYGNIINIASVYGVIAPKFEIYEGTAMTMPAEYAAIKSAVIHLSKYIAKSLKGMHIRVNCISPVRSIHTTNISHTSHQLSINNRSSCDNNQTTNNKSRRNN